jgi:hypothetical protein
MAGIEPRSGNSGKESALFLRLVNHQAGTTQSLGGHNAFVHSFVHTQFELGSWSRSIGGEGRNRTGT